jgi:hypothetical protein
MISINNAKLVVDDALVACAGNRHQSEFGTRIMPKGAQKR